MRRVVDVFLVGAALVTIVGSMVWDALVSICNGARVLRAVWRRNRG